MDVRMLVAIARFSEIYEEEGEAAAIAWAESEALTLEGFEESDSEPRLRIVR